VAVASGLLERLLNFLDDLVNDDDFVALDAKRFLKQLFLSGVHQQIVSTVARPSVFTVGLSLKVSLGRRDVGVVHHVII